MKQIFYIAGVIILMIFAYRLMAKIKDIPEKQPGDFLTDFDDNSEDEDFDDDSEDELLEDEDFDDSEDELLEDEDELFEDDDEAFEEESDEE
jgi:hypothetical protein